jgi:hypothetical protein
MTQTEGRRINPAARRTIYIILGLIVLAGVLILLSFAFSDQLFRLAIKPAHDFAAYEAPPAPDYGDPDAWAALPGHDNPALAEPSGLPVALTDERAADVFFVHPTTFISRRGWNAPVENGDSGPFTVDDTLKNQASVFNACCRIFAPRYRQATLSAFFERNDNAWQAFDLAYGDIERAFDHYIEHWNDGRPFIIASHSQGSLHALRMIESRIVDTPLARRFVAGYTIGYTATEDTLSGRLSRLGVCDGPRQTACLVGWMTFGPEGGLDDAEDAVMWRPGGYRATASRNALCVNPLSWRADNERAPADLNLGAVAFSADGILSAPTRGVTGAQCRDGALFIATPRAAGFQRGVVGKDNYHVYDYNLFYMNIRRNAQDRIEAFLARQRGSD